VYSFQLIVRREWARRVEDLADVRLGREDVDDEQRRPRLVDADHLDLHELRGLPALGRGPRG
jgi:hypothetical protein